MSNAAKREMNDSLSENNCSGLVLFRNFNRLSSQGGHLCTVVATSAAILGQ